jgi:hypothetical protein
MLPVRIHGDDVGEAELRGALKTGFERRRLAAIWLKPHDITTRQFRQWFG